MDERYARIAADTPPVVVSVEIAASPGAIWDLVSDINLPARFSDEFVGAHWLDPPGSGARFIGRNDRDNIGGWQTECTVTEWVPCKAFEWTVGDVDEPTAVWRFDIESVGPHATLIMSAHLGPGRSFLKAMFRMYPDQGERLVEQRMEHWRYNMTATVEGVRSMIEPG